MQQLYLGGQRPGPPDLLRRRLFDALCRRDLFRLLACGVSMCSPRCPNSTSSKTVVLIRCVRVMCAGKGEVTIDHGEYKDNCLDLPKYFDDGYLFI